MDDTRLSIGDFAGVTGLTARALRLYDDAGALVPISVDPLTGYRSYAPSQIERAELIRLLRAGGVAVADLRAVLDTTPAEAAALLDTHLDRADELHSRARAAIHLVRNRITTSPTGDTMSKTIVPRAALAAAVRTAGRCCAADPEPVPSLTGIRLRVDADGLHLASSDRYSAAFVDLPCTWDVPTEAERLVPAGFLIGAAHDWPDEVPIELHPDGLLVAGIPVPTIDERYPDLDSFRPLLASLESGCTVDAAALIAALPATDGPSDDEPVAVLTVDQGRQELLVSVKGRDVEVDDRRELRRLPATVRRPMDTSWVSPARLRGILEVAGVAVQISLASASPIAIAPAGDASRAFLLMPMASADTEKALARA